MREDIRALVEQADQLAKDRVERNARIRGLEHELERLRVALRDMKHAAYPDCERCKRNLALAEQPEERQ